MFFLAILISNLRSCLVKAPNKVGVPQEKSCINPELKSQGFYVQSYVEAIDVIDDDSTFVPYERVRFFASMKPREPPSIGVLNAYPGECQDVRVGIDYRRCGIATALLTKCLLDDHVTKNGGMLQPTTPKPGQPSNLVNFETSLNPGVKYGIWRDQRFANLATEHCQTLIAMPCHPHGNTNSCNVYFDAAISVGYKHIYMDKHNANNHSIRKSVMRTLDAKNSFNANNVVFLEDRGINWFFCKCKKEKEEECNNMDLSSYDVS